MANKKIDNRSKNTLAILHIVKTELNERMDLLTDKVSSLTNEISSRENKIRDLTEKCDLMQKQINGLQRLHHFGID